MTRPRTSSSTCKSRAASDWEASRSHQHADLRRRGFREPTGLPVKWKNEWATNYELGTKMQFLDHRVHTERRGVLKHRHQGSAGGVDAGNCSSRLTVNVPAKVKGLEAELFRPPQPDLGLRGVGTTRTQS